MAIYTLEEFASYVQSDVDTYTATLLRDLALGALQSASGMTLTAVADDVVLLAAPEGPWLSLPQLPAEEPTLVKVDGETVTDWSFDVGRLYRTAGWQAYDTVTGAPLRVEVTYSHGYATFPSDLKRIALQAAARAYINPQGLRQHSETIGSETYSDTYATESLALAVDLTPKEKREVRRALGIGGAFSVDTVSAYERPGYLV